MSFTGIYSVFSGYCISVVFILSFSLCSIHAPWAIMFCLC